LFINAVEELKSMGFSGSNISAIAGTPESREHLIANPILIHSRLRVQKINLDSWVQ
jgi:hypothetical protein